MRHHGPTHVIPALLIFLLFIQGCARPVLETYPADEQESAAVLEAFARFQEMQEEACGCCLDAEVDAAVAVAGWFRDHTGKLSGYLQAMKPGYLKFIGLNPLGQPLLILATDGNAFISLNVYEEKAYTGSVQAAAYRKIAPAGFDAEFSFYWLTGRLPPHDWRVGAVRRDKERQAFWLQIDHADTGIDSMVLFDPEAMVILRHVLRDEPGAHLVDVRYMDYLSLPAGDRTIPGGGPAEAMCRMPARIAIAARKGEAKIDVRLQSFLAPAHLTPADFTIPVPDHFELLPVK